MRIAINGFGRIGRAVFRLLNSKPGTEVAAINDIADPAALAYLLRHDTVMGPFGGDATIVGDTMRTSTQTVKMTAASKAICREFSRPIRTPWGFPLMHPCGLMWQSLKS